MIIDGNPHAAGGAGRVRQHLTCRHVAQVEP